ncbi:MAG TPA: response regulator transcription factor [Gemmatimonadaceae bacterium]|nr:response regulator transcription factor [Gemmatimonadaceae bacterium]
MRLLLVEDDPRLGATLAKGLREQSYAVDLATDGERALYLAALNPYDAVVLDVMLPVCDGFEVCSTLRTRGDRVPVLMLTARDTVADTIAGLDAGADDYLTKPFAFEELVARLRALLRRGAELVPSTLAVGDLVVDTRSQNVRRAGRRIALTAKEYALLEYLARHVGCVLGRAEICAHVWDDNHDPFSNAIEVYINRLRRKVDAGAALPLIHTRRGAGYMLADLAALEAAAAESAAPRAGTTT